MKNKTSELTSKRALRVLLVAVIVYVASTLLWPSVGPSVCALADHTPWGFPVIVNDNSFAFRHKPADLEPFDFYYIDQGMDLPLVYVNHYSETANEIWVLPLRDLQDSGVQGKNDLCVRRVYTIAE